MKNYVTMQESLQILQLAGAVVVVGVGMQLSAEIIANEFFI